MGKQIAGAAPILNCLIGLNVTAAQLVELRIAEDPALLLSETEADYRSPVVSGSPAALFQLLTRSSSTETSEAQAPGASNKND